MANLKRRPTASVRPAHRATGRTGGSADVAAVSAPAAPCDCAPHARADSAGTRIQARKGGVKLANHFEPRKEDRPVAARKSCEEANQLGWDLPLARDVACGRALHAVGTLIIGLGKRPASQGGVVAIFPVGIIGHCCLPERAGNSALPRSTSVQRSSQHQNPILV